MDETRVTRGPKAADYFEGGAFPDKTATTGHFIAVMPQTGSPFLNWPVHMPTDYDDTKDTKLQVGWFSVSVTTGSIRLKAEFQRLVPGGVAFTSTVFGTAKSVTKTVNGTLATLTIADIILTNADLGTLVKNDWGRLKVTRDTGHAGDTMVGDALFYGWTMNQDS